MSAKIAYITGKANMKQLAYKKVHDSTIKLVYEAFIESTLAFHISIAYGHLSRANHKL